MPGKSNYFIGHDPNRWRTNVANYAKVKYANVYPGVDLVYYGHQQQLEYDFVVQPGADPSHINLAIKSSGTTSSRHSALRLDHNGNLVIGTGDGEVIFHKPVIYQPAADAHSLAMDREQPTRRGRLMEGSYKLKDSRVSFELTSYDTRRPLVIDPTLTYSTYLGRNDFEEGYGIAVDGSGNAYVTGWTDSTNFPITPGAFQTSLVGSTNAFVSKLNPTGSDLVYSTYLGGSRDDSDLPRIAVDGSGNAYVTGTTQSTDFPITPGAFQTSLVGLGNPTNAFVSKLNPTGSALIYSTYLGGLGEALGLGIAVDGSGNAYVTGAAGLDFPTTPGAFQTSCNRFFDVFVSKLNADGSALLYSTCLVGSKGEGGEGSGIAVDGWGNAYVTGTAGSTDFPVTPGAFQTRLGGQSDAFISKLNVGGSNLVYSTYLGGSIYDEGLGIALDRSGNAYVTGFTTSTDFPTTPGAFQTSNRGPSNAFVSKLNVTGSKLLYSSYLGGSGNVIFGNGEWGRGVAVDDSGNAYVTGFTFSTDFPTTPGVFQSTFGGGTDAFVSKFSFGPSIPFAQFGGHLRIDPDTGIFFLNGDFTVGPGGSIDPHTQQVTFGVGNYSVTLPAGSFAGNQSGYVYQKTVNNIFLCIYIRNTSTPGSYSLLANSGHGALTTTTNPVPVTLTIGDNSGTTRMNAKFN